jgi:alpha-L-rhamnosidase
MEWQHDETSMNTTATRRIVLLRTSPRPAFAPPRRARKFSCLLLAAALGAFGSGSAAGTGLRAGRLRCEYLEDPLGIDVTPPRLGWVLQSTGRRQMQTAYQILVAGSLRDLNANRADLWDSGKVVSDETAHVSYRGKPLGSRQPCFWKVRVWDQNGTPSGFSEPASWEMGLLEPGEWRAQWIARTTDLEERPAPMLRHEFALDGKIKKARVYICGLGYHELHINGRVVGDHLLDPGYTRYDRRVLYVTHDVTPWLKRGANAVGVMLGHGWFNVQTRAVWDFHKAPWREAPKLLLSLVIEYTDGRTVAIGSDPSWKTATGPVIFNSIYGGENYDARLEKPGWDKPGYDDSSWDPAQPVSAPKGKLVAQMMPPIKADQILKPVKITEPKPGIFLFDLGQNFAGLAELKVRGPAGTKVVMRYGERLFPDGTLDTRDIEQHVKKLDPNQQHQTDTYILAGNGLETWRSRFTYHGFQYVEVTGFPGQPGLDSLRGVFIHSAVPVVGKFECSNPMLNRIARAARWAYLSNLQGIPTDCPHREKNGWTGDAHLACEQGLFNYDGAAVYTKWLNDLGDEQQPTGELPGIVPTSGWGYKWGNGPAWDSAFLLIPYYLYEYGGDAQPLRDHYAGLKRYVDYLTGKAQDGIVSIGLPDWAPFETKTPAEVTSTGYYYRDALIVSLAASLLGKTDDAARYTQLAVEIKKSFNAKFFKADSALYANGSQTALSCALYQGLVEPEYRKRVLDQLVGAVEKRNGHIDTGILGAKYLLNALSDGGRTDVAYRVASQKDLPSWGWWIEQGATTLWEQWNGSESRNHIMFGNVVAWFYKDLAGIHPDPAAPGFKHVLLKPQPVGDLTFARAEHDSVRGRIVSDWKIEQGRFKLRVVIPPNTRATVFVPGASVSDVREGRGPATKSNGVKSFRDENGSAVFEIESGEYEFTAPRRP